MTKLLPLLIALMVLFAPRAEATVFLLSATLDGASASAGAGTGSPGTGTMTGTYDDGGTPATGGILSWNLSYSGLNGSVTAAHFHGDALPNQNAGVQVGIGTDNPSNSSAAIDATQATGLLNDLWYINIHTTTNSSGEIRGQVLVVPEPSRAVLLIIGALMIPFRRRR